MTRQRLILISFCTAAALTCASCREDGDSGKYFCDKASQCAENLGGDVSYWKCERENNKCVAQIPEHCFNAVLDAGVETDKNCGGDCVSKSLLKDKVQFACNNAATCAVNDDCKSGHCKDKKCAPKQCTKPEDCGEGGKCVPETEGSAVKICVSCHDGAKNQDETDVDCGGSCSKKCAPGKSCKEGTDCEFGICKENKCSEEKLTVADPEKLVINEIFDSASGSPAFKLSNGAKACEFIEIANPTSSTLSLEGLSISLKRTDDTKNATTLIGLSGIIHAKSLAVVNNCVANGLPALTLPSDAADISFDGKTMIISTATYEITIVSADGKASPKFDFTTGKVTNSSFVRDPEFSSASPFKKTTEVSGAADYATPGYCTNGGLYSKDCTTTCGNGKKDGTESDVDCGGVCKGCAIGQACSTSSDCDSGKCDENGKCAGKLCQTKEDCGDGFECGIDGNCIKSASCTDGEKNGDETDIDCGGSKCPGCGVGQNCQFPSDCSTGECTDGKCTGNVADTADPGQLVINEVMAAEDTTQASTSFFTINGDNVKECKFIEIINVSANNVSLDGCAVTLERTDTADKKNTTDLTGTLNSKHALVVHSCGDDALPLPADARSAVLKTTNITQTGEYVAYIACGETKGAVITVPKALKGTSMNLSKDLDMTLTTMVKHTDVEGQVAVASPGYCANGGLFSQGCQNSCQSGKKDGAESDVDCGGPTCPKCASGKSCNIPGDCVTGQCAESVCTGEAALAATLSDLSINEVMGAPKTSDFFAIQRETKQCEFIEIVSHKATALLLDGIEVRLAKDASDFTDAPSKIIALEGTIPASGVAVVSECAIPLPGDAVGLQRDIKMTNGSPYAIWLSKGDEKGGLVIRAALSSSNGKSQNRSQDLATTEKEALVFHDTVAANTTKNLNSPGYCVNGGMFSAGCKVPELDFDTELDKFAQYFVTCLEEGGDAEEIKRSYSTITECRAEIASYFNCVTSKACKDWNEIKDEEENCNGDVSCVDNLYRTKGCLIQSNAANTCAGRKVVG